MIILLKKLFEVLAQKAEDIFHAINVRTRLQLALSSAQNKLLSISIGKVTSITKNTSLNIIQFSTYESFGGASIVAYNLHYSFKRLEHSSVMFVGQKVSKDESIISIVNRNKDEVFFGSCVNQGQLFKNYLSTFDVPTMDEFSRSNIIHFHNLHGEYFNYLAMPGIVRLKPALWTLHDMQAITGHCANSLGCEKWKTGCGSCPSLDEYPAISKDSTKKLWHEKHSIFSGLDIDIVVPSKWLLDIVKQSILSDKNIHLIYNGIDTDIFYPSCKDIARDRLGIPSDKIVLVTSAAGGSKNLNKGAGLLHEALKKVTCKQEIVIIKIGDEVSSLQEQELHWIGTGHVYDTSKVREWYSAADIFVFPSIAENCPLAVLEAMACGLPSVAFNTGGIPELIDHMECGYIANYKDVDDFANGISLFTHNKALRQRAGERARTKIKKGFTLQSMTSSYLDLYYEIIKKRAN